MLTGSRERQLLKALVSSGASKIVSAIFTLVALPIAKRALGTDQFVAFGILTVVLGWFSMANIAVGPYLSLALPDSVARRSLDQGVRAVSVAFFSAATLAALEVAALALPPTRRHLAAALAPSGTGVAVEALLSDALLVVGLAAALGMMLSVAESVRLGLQEQHVASLWIAAGIAGATVAVLVVSSAGANLVTIAWAALFAPTLGRILNAFLLWCRDHPQLRPRTHEVHPLDVIQVLKTNGLYSVVQLAGLLGYPAALILVSKYETASRAAGFFVVTVFLTLAAGLVFPLLTPMLPALRDALSSNDRQWAIRGLRAGMVASLLVGAATFVFLAFGGVVLGGLYGSDAVSSLSVRLLMGAFFVLTMSENAFYTLGLAFLSHTKLTSVMAGRGAATLLLLLILTPSHGVIGACLALLLGIGVTTLPLFPLMYLRVRRDLQMATPHEEAPDG